jgi:hypothetical protein
MRCLALIVIMVSAVLASCAKPLATAHTVDMNSFSREFAAVPNDAYYAVRWALKERGISVAEEDLPGGIVKSSWMPVTSDSHYVEIFDRRDFGVTNSYYRVEVQLTDRGGRTLVRVATKLKTLVNNMQSSGEVEYGVLNDVGNYLRKGAPEITNLGVND